MVLSINLDDFLKINEFDKERQEQILLNLLGLQLNGFNIMLINNDKNLRLLVKENLSYETVQIR